ncbi:MAG: hypothetical protein ACE5JO_07730 [Candidatus Binatia bacterium]
MSLFSKFQRSRSADVGSQAKRLVAASQILATDSYTDVAKRFDLVHDVPTDRWDFILTIAGVFIAVSRLEETSLSDSQKHELSEVVATDLTKWDSKAVAAFEDCREFFNRTYDGSASESPYKDDPTYLATDALGSWIVWNLFDHAPEATQERQLVRVLGGLATHSFFRWWSPS